MQKRCLVELTASGNVRDLHPVPFSSSLPVFGSERTYAAAKVYKKNRKAACNFLVKAVGPIFIPEDLS
jgi:hypothetical protein